MTELPHQTGGRQVTGVAQSDFLANRPVPEHEMHRNSLHGNLTEVSTSHNASKAESPSQAGIASVDATKLAKILGPAEHNYLS